jgi:D-glycero-alpha-D-manno-heptose 1-phosphate guanylyltransferase
MEAIILAGGLGTRLRDVVSDVPKPMALIRGKPFLELLLHHLEQKGFDRIILSVGYMANSISDYFGNKFGNLELCYEVEATPLGTGGALQVALRKCCNDHIFVFNGDTFLDLEVESVEALWADSHNPIIVAREVPNMTRYGQLVTENGRVVKFLPKGKASSGLINAGCYLLPKNILSKFQMSLPFSLELDFFPEYIQSNSLDIFISKGYFIDIGIPEDYFLAQELLDQ